MATRTNRLKSAAAQVPVPQSMEALNGSVAEIGVLQRELARIEADMNDELAAVKETYAGAATPRLKRLEELTAGAKIFAEAHRETLTQNGRTKTVRLMAGEIVWRTNPPRVAVVGDEEDIIAACRELGLKEFIREKPTLDKDAIKANPEEARRVPGLRITQSETFEVKPFEAELAGVAA